MNSYHSDPIGLLMLRYLDGALDAEGVSVLNQRLASDVALRREVAYLLIQEVQLQELGEEQRARAAASVFGRFKGALATAVFGWLRYAIQLWRYRARWACATALSAAVLGLWLLLRGAGTAAEPRLTASTGAVTIEREGKQLPALPGFRLRAGDEVHVQSSASAVVRYPREGTILRLSDLAKLRVDSVGPGKRLALLSGSLSVLASRQPVNHPLRVVTPIAEATVLGTDFVLAADPDATRLEVWTGQVRLTKLEDQTSTDVTAGELAVARPGVPLSKTPAPHGVLREFWLGVQLSPGSDLAQASCLTQTPNGSALLPTFQSPQDVADKYFARFRTLIRPPSTGEYRFWVTADDGGEVWLSSDDQPTHKRKICYTTIWTGPEDWERSPSQQSAPIPLEAGRTYYLEALQQEAAGADSLAVAWSIPGQPRQVIDGVYMAPPASRAPEAQDQTRRR